MTHAKKLIEVALPLDAINRASAREKSIRHGHPSTLHLWWARRPLAAARAVIFAQLVDDPSAWPDDFPTQADQERERARLFALIEELVLWENTTNEDVLRRARSEIRRSWRRTCAANADDPRAAELFDPDRLPAFHDPFAGGGALPLEAQRLGLEAHASDLNPVAVLINKAMIEIPPKFAGRAPVNPKDRARMAGDAGWPGASGLAADVRHYGQWMRDQAERRIGHLYPKIEVTAAMVHERPDLKPYEGRELTVIAWLWARTVKSPNPAFADVDVPLATTFMLSTKKGREAYVEPVVEGRGYRFEVRAGMPPDPEGTKVGTSAGRRRGFMCLMSGAPVPYAHIRTEGKAGRMAQRLMAVVAQGVRERVYLTPTRLHATAASRAEPTWKPDCELPTKHRNFQGPAYGMGNVGDLFTARQLVALGTFSDLVSKARGRIHQAANTVGLSDGNAPLVDGGSSSAAYADAVAVYLAFAVDKVADRNSAICAWASLREHARNTFGRQAIPMVWDFAESNPFSGSSGNFEGGVTSIHSALKSISVNSRGCATQDDAQRGVSGVRPLVSTDPPYFDNVSYADLSDFFYVWLRRCMKGVYGGLFATLAVPKEAELVATPHRHGGKLAAERFFLDGMQRAMTQLSRSAHPAFPTTIYYAFKQSESKRDAGMASTGWETFLAATITSGFQITGTWPMRTELRRRLVGMGSNALASSVVLVCRRRRVDAPLATRREFISGLRNEIPPALAALRSGGVAPVDLEQAAIGPGMAVYTRYAKVLDAQGEQVSVREALALINRVLDEVLAAQEGDFDADTRWAVAWFEQYGFAEADFGAAETLSKAKNTSVGGLVDADILASRAGKVRLLRPDELPVDWDPSTDTRLTAWEVVHHLVRTLEGAGESATADLVRRLGGIADVARDLAYRLYAVAERGKRAQEARSYNGLVQSWPEILRLARSQPVGQTGDLLAHGDVNA